MISMLNYIQGIQHYREKALRKLCSKCKNKSTMRCGLNQLKQICQCLYVHNICRGQGKNPEWRKERRERLTASNFGRYVVVVYHVTIVAIGHGLLKKFWPFGNRLRSRHCSAYLYMKLCRPAYFVRTTQKSVSSIIFLGDLNNYLH